ncbi:unnamed protein product, partial [Mesorhabditis spiculigera]
MRTLSSFALLAIVAAVTLAKEIPKAQQADALDATKEIVKGKAIHALDKSRASHETMRECSCKEMDECIEDMKTDAKQCFDPCFDEFKKIQMVEKPDILKQCIKDKERVLDRVMPCIKTNLHACTDGSTEKKVPTLDFNAFIGQVEDDIETKADAFLKTVKSKEMNTLAAALKSGQLCFKNCFLNEKNPKGNCFERKGCMPHITDAAAKKTIDTCGDKIDWGHEMETMCTCGKQAGLG